MRSHCAKQASLFRHHLAFCDFPIVFLSCNDINATHTHETLNTQWQKNPGRIHIHQKSVWAIKLCETMVNSNHVISMRSMSRCSSCLSKCWTSGTETWCLELTADNMTCGNGLWLIASDTATLHSWFTANLLQWKTRKKPDMKFHPGFLKPRKKVHTTYTKWEGINYFPYCTSLCFAVFIGELSDSTFPTVIR